MKKKTKKTTNSVFETDDEICEQTHEENDNWINEIGENQERKKDESSHSNADKSTAGTVPFLSLKAIGDILSLNRHYEDSTVEEEEEEENQEGKFFLAFFLFS